MITHKLFVLHKCFSPRNYCNFIQSIFLGVMSFEDKQQQQQAAAAVAVATIKG